MTTQRASEFIRVWRFRATPDHVQEFESVYGSAGQWAQLFATSSGYEGTELLKAVGLAREYLVLDRWLSRMYWEEFLRLRAREYEELDRRCSALTEAEILVGEYEI